MRIPSLFLQIIIVAVGLLFFAEKVFAGPVTRECAKSCPSGYVCKINNSADTSGDSDSCVPQTTTNNGTNAAQAASCIEEMNSLTNECNTQVSEATYSCDEKNDSGVSGFVDTAAQLTVALGQKTASDLTASCSKAASFVGAANVALAAYRLNCNSVLNSCKAACGKLLDYTNANAECINVQSRGAAEQLVASAEGLVAKCDSFDAKVQEANQAIQNFTQTLQSASQCASLSSGDSLPAICVSNPTLPGCTDAGPVDCTKPEMATNKVCVCSKNPSDPMCVGTMGASGGVSLSSTNPNSRLNTSASDSGLGGDLPSLPGIAHGKASSGGGENIDGRQGGGAGISSSGGGVGGGSPGGGGYGGSGSSVAVNAGFYGAGGGGGSGGGYGANRGSGSGGSAYRGTAGAKGSSTPNLRKFLPGGTYDPRKGVSGMSGPDGITGPHSNIWQKVKNRYRVMSVTLLP